MNAQELSKRKAKKRGRLVVVCDESQILILWSVVARASTASIFILMYCTHTQCTKEYTTKRFISHQQNGAKISLLSYQLQQNIRLQCTSTCSLMWMCVVCVAHRTQTKDCQMSTKTKDNNNNNHNNDKMAGRFHFVFNGCLDFLTCSRRHF